MSRSVAILGTRGYPSHYGGFETAVRKIAPFLVSRGWTVTVYGRRGSIMKENATGGESGVISKYSWGVESKSLSTLSFGATSTFDVAVSKPDVALVMNVANGFWLPMLKARRVPTVVNVDGVEWERDKWGVLAKSVFRFGAKVTAQYADEIVCDSREIQRIWAVDFGRNGVYIPYGGTVLKDLPVPAGLTSGRYVLLVSRLVPENSIEPFLAAVPAILDRADVVIVGSSGYRSTLEQEVSKLAHASGRVHWLGHVHNEALLHSLWAHAGVYFHGHTVGGTNPALVQAMACGTPVVARDTIYNREVLGSAGTYVGPNPGEITRAVISMLDAPESASRRGSAARDRVARYYSWDSVCEAYEAVLEHALGIRRRSS